MGEIATGYQEIHSLKVQVVRYWGPIYQTGLEKLKTFLAWKYFQRLSIEEKFKYQ